MFTQARELVRKFLQLSDWKQAPDEDVDFLKAALRQIV
jgi:hypothetical protein